MKIYLAGRISQQQELHEVRKQLWQLGHEVVSTWIDEGGSKGDRKSLALRDLCQISQADVLILDTTSPLAEDGGGGREFEAGFAIGQFQHKKVWRVGPEKNAFHSLIQKCFNSWNDVYIFLEGLNNE